MFVNTTSTQAEELLVVKEVNEVAPVNESSDYSKYGHDSGGSILPADRGDGLFVRLGIPSHRIVR